MSRRAAEPRLRARLLGDVRVEARCLPAGVTASTRTRADGHYSFRLGRGQFVLAAATRQASRAALTSSSQSHHWRPSAPTSTAIAAFADAKAPASALVVIRPGGRRSLLAASALYRHSPNAVTVGGVASAFSVGGAAIFSMLPARAAAACPVSLVMREGLIVTWLTARSEPSLDSSWPIAALGTPAGWCGAHRAGRGYLCSMSVKMSVSPMPVRAIAVFRPSVHTG